MRYRKNTEIVCTEIFPAVRPIEGDLVLHEDKWWRVWKVLIFPKPAVYVVMASDEDQHHMPARFGFAAPPEVEEVAA